MNLAIGEAIYCLTHVPLDFVRLPLYSAVSLKLREALAKGRLDGGIYTQDARQQHRPAFNPFEQMEPVISPEVFQVWVFGSTANWHFEVLLNYIH